MFPLKKGKTTVQAHLVSPLALLKKNTDERASSENLPISTTRIHRRARTRSRESCWPHCFDQTAAGRLPTPKVRPLPFWRCKLKLLVSRRSEPDAVSSRNTDRNRLFVIEVGIMKPILVLQFSRGSRRSRPCPTCTCPNKGTSPSRSQQQSLSNLKGLIGQHALYDPGVINDTGPETESGRRNEWEVRQGQFQLLVASFNPLDVVGWKGDLTVWKINMEISARSSPTRTSSPGATSTFVTKGAVVCSFLPALLRSPQALQSFHRNTDYDEFIFYHDGNFFSRDNIVAGIAVPCRRMHRKASRTTSKTTQRVRRDL